MNAERYAFESGLILHPNWDLPEIIKDCAFSRDLVLLCLTRLQDQPPCPPQWDDAEDPERHIDQRPKWRDAAQPAKDQRPWDHQGAGDHPEVHDPDIPDGSRSAPMNASAMATCPKASQSVP